MLRKNLFLLFIYLTIFATSYTIENKQPDIGELIINDKEINSSWSYLTTLTEYFLDDNIKAIVIILESNLVYSSKAFSLAKSIVSLKKKYKKPVIAYSEDVIQGSIYIIAASADYIMTSPMCILGNLGYHANYPDFSKQHSKNGIHENCIKGGKYKYLANPNHPISNDDLQILQNQINTGWKTIIKELIQLRPKLNKHKNKWINGQIFVANQILDFDNFFIDKIGDKLDLNNFVSQLINKKNLNLTIKQANLDLEKIEINKDKNNKIIVLNASNSLQSSDSNYYLDLFSKSFDDENTLGIIINIDVTGANSAGLMYNLYTQIKKLKQAHNKPVVAYIDNYAFSGGYWLACCADFIISSPLAEVGSIGARWSRFDLTGQDAKNEVIYHAISANKFGNLSNEHTILSSQEESHIQKVINIQHAGFIKQVIDARPKLKKNIKDWKEAQIYTAYRALNLGLIDAIGCPIDAIKYIIKDKDLKDIKIVFDNLTINETSKK